MDTSKTGSGRRRWTSKQRQRLLGQAIDYALKRWEALTRFIDDGTLEIDNNLIENAIRPSALGKKNWLFVGYPEAGERSAVIYTLLGSCRRHDLTPFNYLKDLFAGLPAAKITEIKQFRPAAWAKAKAKGKLVAQAAWTDRQPGANLKPQLIAGRKQRLLLTAAYLIINFY